MPTDPRAFQLELAGLSEAAGRAAAVDPLRAGPAAAGAWKAARPLFGRVITSVPYARTYKVQVEGLNAAIPCRDLTQTSLVPYGPRQFSTYSPGTGVLVFLHPQLPEGIIVGAFPDAGTDPRLSVSDFITQGGRTGLKVDVANSLPFSGAHNGGISDFSAGRPADSVGGEWGVMTETGLGLFLDPFQVYLRADEETGVWCFYHDQLLRVAGHNLQERSILKERLDSDDRGELTGEAGWATYLWEAQGRGVIGSYPSVELSAEQTQLTDASRTRYEPYRDDQTSFHRLTEYHGYLGQGYARFLAVPPYANTSAWPWRLSHDAAPIGVFAEHLSVSGRYTAVSAKGYTIGKTASVSVPKRRKSAADPTGDKAENYSASGTAGGGRLHAIQDNTAPVVSDGTTGIAAIAAVTDQLGYQYNWEGAHPFFYHELDWYLPDVSESGLPRAAPPTYTALAGNQYLPASPSTTIDVDHRMSAKYHAAESFLHFADDGSLVLADGYGAELRMSQGSIFLSAPGDIWVQPGKNLNAWCGHDAIVKARGSVDLTASVGDVRVKAQHNVMVAGGFDTCGGVLLESRGQSPSYDFTPGGEAVRMTGILLISRTAPVVAAGKDVLLTTDWRRYGGEEIYSVESSPNESLGEFSGGNVCIDAGEGTVNTYGRVVKTHVGEAVIDVFAPADGDLANYVVNEFWADRAAIGSSLDVRGRLFAMDKLMVGDNAYVGGAVANGSGVMSVIDDVATISAAVAQTGERALEMSGYAGAARHDGRGLPEDGSILPGSFTYRHMAEYKTNGLVLYESRWQQQARQTGEDVLMFGWNETPAAVLGGGPTTYPHPGEVPWLSPTYRHQDATLYDVFSDDGWLDRGAVADPSVYETPRSPSPDQVILAENYLMLFES